MKTSDIDALIQEYHEAHDDKPKAKTKPKADDKTALLNEAYNVNREKLEALASQILIGSCKNLASTARTKVAYERLAVHAINMAAVFLYKMKPLTKEL